MALEARRTDWLDRLARRELPAHPPPRPPTHTHIPFTDLLHPPGVYLRVASQPVSLSDIRLATLWSRKYYVNPGNAGRPLTLVKCWVKSIATAASERYISSLRFLIIYCYSVTHSRQLGYRFNSVVGEVLGKSYSSVADKLNGYWFLQKMSGNRLVFM